MATLYWIGATLDWHTATNWSQSSGGPADGWVPTAVDDVVLDGGGYVLCWASAPFECLGLTLAATATEMVLADQGGIIHGDFTEAAGYFGPTGGGGYTVEFRGNWLKTGGTFAVGTGTGVDPTCEFSGTGKTYQLNDTGAATYQHLLVSGEVVFSGTRLSVAWINQDLRITGTLEVSPDNRIDLDGSFAELTGELTSTTPLPWGTVAGRLIYTYNSGDSVPTGGVISIGFFRLLISDPLVVLNPRVFASGCKVEIEYTADGQTFRFEGSAWHQFMGSVRVYADDIAILTAEWDCATEDAQLWFQGAFDVDKDAFPNGTFTMRWGDRFHVARSAFKPGYFSYASATSHLVIDPGEGTLILWPQGRTLVPLP